MESSSVRDVRVIVACSDENGRKRKLIPVIVEKCLAADIYNLEHFIAADEYALSKSMTPFIQFDEHSDEKYIFNNYDWSKVDRISLDFEAKSL